MTTPTLAGPSNAGPSTIPYTLPLPDGIPPTHTTHTESTTTILVPRANTAFVNPVQEYNRDLSISVIRAWNEVRKERLKAKWESKGLTEEQIARKREKSKRKKEQKAAARGEAIHGGKEDATEGSANGGGAAAATHEAQTGTASAGPSERIYRAPPITILEALSATGLRSIRYAKEIPDVKFVLANDLSPSACEAMRTNIALNGVGEDQRTANASSALNGDDEEMAATSGEPAAVADDAEGRDLAQAPELRRVGRREGSKGRVRVTERDACDLMYSHRAPQSRVDVVDLDPYGTAAPFLDSAVGCIADGGLLAVTCTDVAVLAGTQYPEKCFSNYGGTCVAAEYSHEVALRLVLHSVAQAAARYGRYITPLLSFSIDFYVRLFIRIDTSAQKVKELASQTGAVYVCGFCQASTIQPFGRIIARENRDGKVNTVFRTAAGPPVGGSTCEHCGGTLHIGGPMWLGPIHDAEFAARALQSIEGQQADYKTWARMNGMLHTAKEELTEPFYFTPNKLFGMFHASSGPSSLVLNAILNAGYSVSRSHASSGSLKTTAPRAFVYDVVREYIKTNPVRIDKIAEGSPARRLLEKEMTHTVDFKPHPDAKRFERGEKIVRYQVNPTANWGPGVRAKVIQNPSAAPAPAPAAVPAPAPVSTGAGGDSKRKADEVPLAASTSGEEGGDDDASSKKAKISDAREVDGGKAAGSDRGVEEEAMFNA